MIGKEFGRLRVVAACPVSSKHWICVCVCGAETRKRKDHLMNGLTRSCGCLSRELSKQRALAGVPRKNNDNHSKHPIYSTWHAMRQRCNNKSSPYFRYYGGRGIGVCERWEKSFNNFLADMGERPAGATLDRINNDGNYEPGNCRWATRSEQQNNRSINRLVTYAGRTQTLMQWSRERGIHHNTLDRRLTLDWPMDKVMAKGRFYDLSGLALGVEARRKKRLQRLK